MRKHITSRARLAQAGMDAAADALIATLTLEERTAKLSEG